MEKKNKLLTPIEFMSILIGGMIGTGILSLPAYVTKYANEDGWISIIIGGVYPLYICLMGIYVSKKHPDNNILFLSRKYFGNVIGNIFNFLFACTLIYISVVILSNTSYILRNYLSYFLSKNSVIFIITLTVVYTVLKDLKLIGRLNVVMFLITIFLLMFPIPAIKEGKLLNIQPIFKSNISDILKGVYQSGTAYFGLEVFFLIYPYVENKRKMRNYSLKAYLFVLLSYSWVQFICLYYLGSEVINKVRGPLIIVTDTLIIPLVSNVRYIFVFLWTNIIIKTISNYYFFSSYIIKDIIGEKIKRKYIVFMILPIIFFCSIYFENITSVNQVEKIVTPFAVGYNILFIGIISIFVKRGDTHEKKI